METKEPRAEAEAVTVDRTVMLELTAEQLPLIEAGLKLLLVIEDDREAIHVLKKLVQRVQALEYLVR